MSTLVGIEGRLPVALVKMQVADGCTPFSYSKIKKMKLSNYKLLTILFTTMISIITACGGDDDNQDGSIVSGGTSSIPSDVKPYIGLWDISSNKETEEFPRYNAFFFQDKKCDVTRIGSSKYNTRTTWSYDNASKRFVIEGYADAQWEITAQGEDSWTGLSLWGGNAQQGYVAKRDTTAKNIFCYILANSKWMSGGNVLYGNEYTGLQIDTPEKEYAYSISFTSTWQEEHTYYEDKANDALVYKNIHWLRDKYAENIRGDNEVRVVHPYSYSDCYIDVKLWYYRRGANDEQTELAEFSGRFKRSQN